LLSSRKASIFQKEGEKGKASKNNFAYNQRNTRILWSTEKRRELDLASSLRFGSSYDSTNSNRITQSTTLDDWKWAPTEQANTDRDLPPVQRNNHHVSLFKKRFQHHRHHRGTKKNCQTQDIGSLLRGATGSKSSKANSKTRLRRLREAPKIECANSSSNPETKNTAVQLGGG
jgi:hypothetical protein